jgi:hypothetical protein
MTWEPALILAYLWVFWGMYVLVMGLYRAYLDNRLSRAAKVLGFPYLAFGYVMDVSCNLTIATVVFLELPREGLVTQRLTRLQRSSGWRQKVAFWVCTKLLDPFDPSGKHCS